MCDIVLCFFYKKQRLTRSSKNETRQDADKNLRRKKIDCPASVFFGKNVL